jgi:hypothetical protein
VDPLLETDNEINPEKVQFPVARSAEHFANGKYLGKEFVAALPPDARRVIDDLKPYFGGNESLWTLHQLDIKRKHRALLDVQVRPLRLTMAGANISPTDFVPINNETGWLPVNEKTVLGLLRKGVPPGHKDHAHHRYQRSRGGGSEAGHRVAAAFCKCRDLRH